MWSRYTLPVVGGLATLSLGLNSYEVYRLMHPPATFQASELRFSTTSLAQRLRSHAAPAYDLSKPPASLYHVTPILPVDSINAYLQKTEADLLLLDFSKIDLKDDLFQYIYSKVNNPPPLEDFKKDGGELMCHLLFAKLLNYMRLRAVKHMQMPDTKWYEGPALLTFYYTLRYGEEAFNDTLAKPRYPVVVLKNTDKWKDSGLEEMRKLLDLYVGLLRLAGTAHIFIEGSPGIEAVLEALDAHVPRRPKPQKQPKEPPSD